MARTREEVDDSHSRMAEADSVFVDRVQRRIVSEKSKSRQLSPLEAEDVEDAVGGDGDTLVAVDGEGHRIGDDGSAGLEIPQGFPGACIERVEISFVGTGENQAARSREHARPRRRM